MTYLNRLLESKINSYLQYFPVVTILGARQTGKTTLAKQLRPNWKYFDLENTRDFEFITNDFEFFFSRNSENLIIDEAQRSPELFNNLRGVIDKDREKKGRFIITGSSSPTLKNQINESLAGRVGIIEIGTLKACEIQKDPLPEFYNLFKSKLSEKEYHKIKALTPIIKKETIDNKLLYGGYPEISLSKNTKYKISWLENYIKTYIERDIRNLFQRLDIVRYKRFLSILSSLNSNPINKSEIGRSIDTSEITVRDYLEIAHSTFIWRNIQSFSNNEIKNLKKMPKGIFRDSGIASFLQGIYNVEDLERFPKIGSFFEAYVIEELLSGLNCLEIPEVKYSYYRTRSNAEIDLILKGSFGMLPIEIKYGKTVKLQRLRTLSNFVKDNNLPFGIVINNSTEVSEVAPRIFEIPVSCI